MDRMEIMKQIMDELENMSESGMNRVLGFPIATNAIEKSAPNAA